MTQTPTDALRLVPVELTEAMIEAGCRALHAAQGTGDADAPLHSPPQNSWEEPDSVRWKQWRETITDDVWPALVAAAPASPLPGGGQCSGISGQLKSGEDILWMMRVRGPDDIYPAPDYETAVAWCDYVNDVLAKAVPEVMTKAVPAIWTLSPQEHAAYLPEAIKGWALPAAPTGAKT